MASCAIEEITPEVAREWLDINHRNRTLNQSSVAHIAELIKRGEWMQDSTDAIGLDTDGGVVNGQHRLQAVILADQAIRALVLRDVDPAVIKVIDQGRGRNLAQFLGMDGRYDQPVALAGGLNWMYRIRYGYERLLPQESKPTVPQLLEMLDQHPNVQFSIPTAHAVWQSLKVNKGMLAAYHYAFATVASDKADDFFDQLANGEYLERGDPVHTLRERLVENNGKVKEKQAKNFEIAAWIVKAWTAKQEGAELLPKQLTFRKSGPRAEAVPRPAQIDWIEYADGEQVPLDQAVAA
jgi:hypothetical protein